MAHEADKTHLMTARNTFTAISFQPSCRRLQQVEILDVVTVDGGVIGPNKSFAFHLSNEKQRQKTSSAFADVFREIQHQIADRNMPVVGWGAEPGARLRSLIEACDIDIEYPIRYFNLYDSVCAKMGDEKVAKDWHVVVKRLNVEVVGTMRPTAIDCAKIHLALESTDYQLIVARAFLAFIKSIMDDDNRIDTFEAKGLQAFLSLLTSNFEQFSALRKIVDETLEDDVIEEHESDRLMRELGNMRAKYQTYVDSCDRR